MKKCKKGVGMALGLVMSFSAITITPGCGGMRMTGASLGVSAGYPSYYGGYGGGYYPQPYYGGYGGYVGPYMGNNPFPYLWSQQQRYYAPIVPFYGGYGISGGMTFQSGGHHHHH